MNAAGANAGVSISAPKTTVKHWNIGRCAMYSLGSVGLLALATFLIWQQLATDKIDTVQKEDLPVEYLHAFPRRLGPKIKCGLVRSKLLCVLLLNETQRNLGNTCFMNSALQCLRHIAPIRRFLKRTDILFEIEQQKSMPAQWLRAFNDLINALDTAEWRGYCPDIDLVPIYEAMRRAAPSTFSVAHRQEDSLEVIHYFFEAMEQVAMRSPDAYASWRSLVRYTEIVHQRRWGSPDGPSNSHRVEPSSELRLSVPDQAKPMRLEPLLHLHFEEEPEHRDQLGWFHEIRRVLNAPEVLVVAFNRVNGIVRIQTPIEVPSWFDLRPYMEQDVGTPVMYDLIAVVLHLGRAVNSGHYVASVRLSNTWFTFDDNTVRGAKQSTAVSPRHVWLALFRRRRQQ